MDDQVRDERDLGGAITGAVMIVLGVLFLLDHFGYARLGAWWRLWPLVLVAIGLGKLFAPASRRETGGGVTMLLLGAAFLAINYGFKGLDWSNGWPMFIVAGGAGMVVKALFPDRKEARGG